MLESVVVSLDGRIDLANQVMSHLEKRDITKSITLDKVNSQKFSDGELCVDYENSIRGKRVFILTSPNTSDEIMKINLAIDAAKRAAAKEIIPILPFFPYQRSDKKDQKRGPIGAKVMVEMIEQRGATGIITFDLHADQIQGFFNIPVTHLEGKNVFDDYIASIYNENTILCGPDEEIVLSSCDAGGVKRVKRMVTKLKEKHSIDVNYVVIDKTRTKANSVESITIIGDVKNKHVIIVDDMIDTFGSADKAVDGLIEAGAKSVRMIASHGVLSGPALDKIANSKLTQLIISDSLDLNLPENNLIRNKITVISIANQIAYAITSINSKTSLEKILGNDW
jgi:ribose-phosphate pyrophosphokinase